MRPNYKNMTRRKIMKLIQDDEDSHCASHTSAHMGHFIIIQFGQTKI